MPRNVFWHDEIKYPVDYKIKQMEKLEYAPKIDIMIELISNYEDNGNDLDTSSEPISVMNDEEIMQPYINTLVNLDILQTESGRYSLTNKGNKIVSVNKDIKYQIMFNAIKDYRFIKDVIKFIKLQDDYFTQKDIMSDFSLACDYELTIKVALSWLTDLAVISDLGDKYKYNLDNEIENYNDDIQFSAYPIDYAIELDIKEDKYSVFEYLRKVKSSMIIMNPEFQRNVVWKIHQKSQFIESLILNIPIPPIYLKKENDGKLIIIDGLQRTSTLIEFTQNQFKLTGLNALPKLNGCDFESIRKSPSFDVEKLITRIEDKQLLFYILQPTVPMNIVYDIFNRINTGGTKLARQEIRNCIFIGNSTRLLKSLSKNEWFKKAIGYTGIASNRMKDREAILRCLAFDLIDYQSEYKNSMDEFLEKAMIKINKMNTAEVELLTEKFINTIKISFELFGNKNFRIFSESTNGRVNIAVMETVYNAIINNSIRATDNKFIKEMYSKLIRKTEYLNSVRSSTGTKSKIETRFDLANKILKQQNND